MTTPFPSFTKEWHNTSYSSISPSSPALSQAGKNIIVTGGGSGIGARTVRSFAEAGAANIAILGRRESVLHETAASVTKDFPNVKIFPYVADITNKAAVDQAFASFVERVGKIDVLISNAGFGEADPPVRDADPDTWFANYDVNIKGSFYVTQAFLRSCKDEAVIMSVSSCVSFLLGPTYSSYAASKTALVRFFEIVSMENPGVRVVSLHPGVVDTYLSRLNGVTALDDASLPADFMVWASSPEAEFLDGKYVFVNWDVEELKARKAEIKDSKLLTMWLEGLTKEWSWTLENK